jgi:hypothetical protein
VDIFKNNVREINTTIQYPGELAARMKTIYESFPKVTRVSIEFGGRDLQKAWEEEIVVGIFMLDIQFGIDSKRNSEVGAEKECRVWEAKKGKTIMQGWNENGKGMNEREVLELTMMVMQERLRVSRAMGGVI